MKQGFLDKAQRGIVTAEVLFSAGDYDAGANRAYYACFHVAICLLLHHGIENPKIPHDWVQAQFSAEIIHRRKIFPQVFASYLPKIQFTRQLADYRPDSISKNTAAQQLKMAKAFTQQIFQYLDKQP